MALASCCRCKKMFNKIKSPVCPVCRPIEEAEYEKIHKIVQDHPDLNASEVAERAEVEEAVVQRMLKEGLISNSTINAGITCGRCGAPAISASKKLCQACLEKLNAEMTRAQAGLGIRSKGKAASTGVGMNTRDMLDNKRK